MTTQERSRVIMLVKIPSPIKYMCTAPLHCIEHNLSRIVWLKISSLEQPSLRTKLMVQWLTSLRMSGKVEEDCRGCHWA